MTDFYDGEEEMPLSGWQCPQCDKVNQGYVCQCGMKICPNCSRFNPTDPCNVCGRIWITELNLEDNDD